MTKTKRLGLWGLAGLLALGAFIFAVRPDTAEKADLCLSNTDTSLTSDEYVQIYKKGEDTDYTVIFGAQDSISADSALSQTIQTNISLLGGSIDRRTDTEAQKANEILLGNTNRPLSKEAKDAVNDPKYNDLLVWCIIERDGKVAYTANSDEAFKRGQGDLLSYFTDEGFAVPKGINKVFSITRSEYEAELEAEKEMQKQKRIEELKRLIAGFKYEDFHADYSAQNDGKAPSTSMAGSTFGAPNMYPSKGTHPRLNVTSDMLADIKAYMEMPEAKYTSYYFWKLADTAYDGKLPELTYHPEGNRIGWFNMDEEGLAIIEAKAFAYLLTGDELYAYEAIYAMKNYLLTIDIKYIHSDQCREFGRIIYCTAIVYDWCYPVLTDSDKAQFRVAVADIGSSHNDNTNFGNQMEVGFPPKLGTVVSSHSSEHQVLRDYLSIAIAVFDEDPTWYEWVGGMIYNYYVPFRQYYFQSGTYPQGVNIYAPHRFDADLWSSWMLLCAVGEVPYGDYFNGITHSFFMSECPDGSMFSTGDGDRPKSASEFWHHALITAAIYGDDVLRAQAARFTDNFVGYDGYSLKFSFTQMIILSGSYFSKTDSAGAEDVHEGQDPVSYLGSPLGQITVRERWNDESVAAVFMRIGERTTANHEHEDAGTFQIYYKGLYTGDSGKYAGYASDHWYYYSSTTVAHNGLLISNPQKIGNNPDNAASYFYSGSQRKMSEALNLEGWLSNDGYRTGEVIGAQWSYKNDGSVDFAYIGGDITTAYSPNEAAYVGRHMLTYYTGNPDVPMLLLVYDKIKTLEKDYKKSFLIHTTNEPEVDIDNRTVVSTEGNGRLVLKSLLGGDSFEKIGGTDADGNRYDYAINGRQCETALDGDVIEKWGRVEISPAPALTSHLLNLMFVTDKDSTLMLEPTLLETDNSRGALIDKNVFLFCETEGGRNTDAVKFHIDGNGLYRVIVTGLCAGMWNVTSDGVTVAHTLSSEDGGVIDFYTPAGDIEILPGRDIVPSNGGRIVYNSFGGIVPDDAPLVYEIGVPVTLPTDIYNGANTFEGWYTSVDFDESTRITEVVAYEKGVFNVYAKYAGIIVGEDYEGFQFNMNSGASGGIVYNGKGGSKFVTIFDEKTGNTYLHITKGTSDPNVDVATAPVPYMYGETKLTLSIDLARESADVIDGICRIRGVGGSSDTFPFFTTTKAGLVLLGGTLKVMDLTSQFQTLAVTLDFKEGTATAYDKDGDVLGTVPFEVPKVAGCETTLEWLNTITSTVNWWMGGGETLLVDNFTVYKGDYVPKPVVIPDGYSEIEYNTNGGLFDSFVATIYKEGQTHVLESNLTKYPDTFLGWYTTPDFKEGTEIKQISPDTKGKVSVYAKWVGMILDVDFEGADVEFKSEVGDIDGFGYNGTTSKGAYIKTVKDSDTGNTYLYWHRGEGDPQVKYEGKSNNFPGRHVVTYSISLSATEGETPMAVSFYVRSTRAISQSNPNNRILLFSTKTTGDVTLSDDTSFATVSPYFITDIVVSIDYENGKITAYNPTDGKELASVGFALDNYAEWLDVMNLPLYAYANGGESIKIDNVSILCAPFSVDVDEDSTVGKIDYVLSGGSFDGPIPTHYTKGEGVSLPIPTKKGATFVGWFGDSAFTIPVTQINNTDTENFVLYAKWYNPTVLDFEAKDYDFDFVSPDNGAGKNNAAGVLNFQTQGKGVVYRVTEGADAEKYILWSKTEESRDPQLNYETGLAKTAGGIPVITFSFTLAKNGDEPVLNYIARMRTSSKAEIHLFSVDGSGNVYFNAKATPENLIGTLDTEFKTFNVVVDFAREKIISYSEGEDGTPMTKECALAVSGFDNGMAVYNAITNYLFGLYSGNTGTAGSILIKSIKITSGNTVLNGGEQNPDERNIYYVLGGGSFKDGVSEKYTVGEGMTLPIPTKKGATFVGWFKDAAMTVPVTEITPNDKDHIVLYAKWDTNVVLDFALDDYSFSFVSPDNGGGKNNYEAGLTFQTQGKGVGFTVTDAVGGKYLTWTKTTESRDPQLIYETNLSQKADGKHVLTFSFSMARNGSDPILTFLARMRTSDKAEIHLFTLDENGNVHLGSTKLAENLLGTIDDEFKTFDFVLDFENETITGYTLDGEGNTVEKSITMPIPGNYQNGVAVYNAVTNYLLGLYSGNNGLAGTVLIKSIKITTGNAYAK